MFVLIFGLVIFFGVYLVWIVVDGWWFVMIDWIGEKGWKGGYVIVLIVGFVLIIWGYGIVCVGVMLLWVLLVGVCYLMGMLIVVVFVLIVVFYVLCNWIKMFVGYLMLVGVMVWVVVYFFVNGIVYVVVLFGVFFVWLIVDFVVLCVWDCSDGVCYLVGGLVGDFVIVVVGFVVWVVFVLFLYGLLIGVWLFG